MKELIYYTEINIEKASDIVYKLYREFLWQHSTLTTPPDVSNIRPMVQTQFAFSFQINTDSELKVILGETTLTLSADYTVTIATNGTGTVDYSFRLTTGQKLTILANKPLSRESVYSTGASFTKFCIIRDRL